MTHGASTQLSSCHTGQQKGTAACTAAVGSPLHAWPCGLPCCMLGPGDTDTTTMRSHLSAPYVPAKRVTCYTTTATWRHVATPLLLQDPSPCSPTQTTASTWAVTEGDPLPMYSSWHAAWVALCGRCHPQQGTHGHGPAAAHTQGRDAHLPPAHTHKHTDTPLQFSVHGTTTVNH